MAQIKSSKAMFIRFVRKRCCSSSVQGQIDLEWCRDDRLEASRQLDSTEKFTYND